MDVVKTLAFPKNNGESKLLEELHFANFVPFPFPWLIFIGTKNKSYKTWKISKAKVRSYIMVLNPLCKKKWSFLWNGSESEPKVKGYIAFKNN
jgi:hypothetical protein